MRTYPTSNEADRHISFEIDNALVSRRSVVGILSTISGVTEVQLGGTFGSANDVRVSFKYRDKGYVVWEPYGDNSRYWIGPAELSQDSANCAEIEAAFQRYRPSPFRIVLNALISLAPPWIRAKAS